jgi:septum formation protein
VLVLASSSPRRLELLTAWGYVFRTVVTEVDESIAGVTDPPENACRLAEWKAAAGAELWRTLGGDPADVVIGADTTVVLDDQIFGKPQDPQDAARMLALLSGRRHRVLTGVAICRLNGEKKTEVVESDVYFNHLTSEMISAYCRTPEPLDKAGAYALQGAGGHFVSRVEGSRTNVIGLPMEFLHETLKLWGVEPRDARFSG